MRSVNDPEGLRLPIKVDTATNGEYAPIPLKPVHRRFIMPLPNDDDGFRRCLSGDVYCGLS